MKREDWAVYAGATYPRHPGDSVFVTRPWDDGTMTPEQKRVMLQQRRRIMLES